MYIFMFPVAPQDLQHTQWQRRLSESSCTLLVHYVQLSVKLMVKN